MKENIQKIDCPLEIWLNAKVCLPDKTRGLAIAKVLEHQGELHLILSSDKTTFAGNLSNISPSSRDFIISSFSRRSIKNLASLNFGTLIVLSPPKIFGNSFWLAYLGEICAYPFNGDENLILYSLANIEKMQEFSEDRTCERVSFRTKVRVMNSPKNHSANSVSSEYFSYDISKNGISLVLESEQCPFEEGNSYLLQLFLHEASGEMPPLLYKCTNTRRDIISGSLLAGFELDPSEREKPQVKENLSFLTWSLSDSEQK